MVVFVGAVARGTEQRRRAGAAGTTRRAAARGLLTSVAALALAPVVAASRAAPAVQDPDGTSFDETYRGRRIQGVLVPVPGQRASGFDWRITVDGRPLHLMRRADGTWLSMVDHYTSYRTPLEATRAAVDEIGPGQRLREPATEPTSGPKGGQRGGGMGGETDEGHMGHAMGGRDGVRA
ncbi:tyrosinase family oxidase copper chaperone [Streptomyces sp. NPDC051896]|uniref:tyrosinase family oxidase copper chaperone n=1 Tax=Streptomyces sp. NPDC051896 TaxID=3155416 RepID=UPI00342036E0